MNLKDKHVMPWFVISYDFSRDAFDLCQRFDGLALRYGWDKYNKSNDTFLPLPRCTLIGEFTDCKSARANLVQLCSESYEQYRIVPINVVLLKISN